MGHNVRNLTARASATEGEVLLPAKYGAPKRLTTMSGIRQEAARVYKAVCDGLIPVEDGTKLFYMLDRLGRLAEVEFIEGRLVSLENAKDNSR